MILSFFTHLALKVTGALSAKGIVERVKVYLPQDPISLGKPLQDILKGLYRYRFGDYRIIYSIDRKEKAILILRVA